MNQKQLAAATFGGVGGLDCELVDGQLFKKNGSVCASDCSCQFEDEIPIQMILTSLYVIPVSLTTILFGISADSDRRLIYLAISVFFLGLSQIAVPSAWSYFVVSILRVLTGAAEGAVQPISVTIITSLFVAHKTKAMGVYNWAIYLAYASAIFLNKITENKYWLSYYTLGLLCLVSFNAILILEKTKQKTVSNSIYTKGEENKSTVSEFKTRLLEIAAIARRRETVLLLLGALCRHTAGYTLGINMVDYFKNEKKFENAENYLFFAPIIAGVSGSFLGGMLTDRIQKNERLAGPKAALLVLLFSQFIGAPLMSIVLTIDSPYCFYLLYFAYMIIEMWFGIFLVCYSSMFPSHVQGQAIGYTIFILRLICQNSAALISPLRKILSYHHSMMIMIPGLQLFSAILFLASFCLLPTLSKSPDKKKLTSPL